LLPCAIILRFVTHTNPNDKVSFAEKVLCAADKVRRVLLEVARLEREYPMDDLLALVDQEEEPPSRKLLDVVVPDATDVDTDSDDGALPAGTEGNARDRRRSMSSSPTRSRSVSWIPRKQSMRFRQNALAGASSRRMLQKIYNLEVRVLFASLVAVCAPGKLPRSRNTAAPVGRFRGEPHPSQELLGGVALSQRGGF
jgi:hypothetical protein